MENSQMNTTQDNEEVEGIGETFILGLALVLITVGCFTGSLGNLMTFLGPFFVKDLRNSFFLYLAFMGVADFLTCVYILPVKFLALLHGDWLGQTVCSLTAYTVPTIHTISNLTNALLAINRFAYCFPHSKFCKTLMRRSVSIGLLSGLTVGSIPIILMPFFNGERGSHYIWAMGTCVLNETTLSLHFNGFFMKILPLVTTFVFFSLTLGVLWRRKAAGSNDLRFRQNVKATRTLFFLYSTFLVCWVPHMVSMLIDPAFEIHMFASILQELNAPINPLINALSISKFKDFIVHAFSRRQSKVYPVYPGSSLFNTRSNNTRSTPTPRAALQTTTHI